VAATTLTTSSTVTHNGGTANGVPYLNGSKVLTTGSALVFDGTNLGIGTSSPSKLLTIGSSTTANPTVRLNGSLTGGSDTYQYSFGLDDTADFAGIKLNYADRVSKGLQIFTAPGFSFPITFYTNSATQAMTLDTSGNLLVGTTSASSKLTVYSSTGGGGYFFVTNASSQTTAAVTFSKFDNTTTTAQVFCQFVINNGGTGSGQINANGANSAAFGTYSDSRLKENIVDLPSQLANIMALRPVEYDYIETEGGGHQIGFVAQEVQEIYPDLVGERADGMLTLADMNKNDARLIKAIQEQQALITTLTARITALEGA